MRSDEIHRCDRDRGLLHVARSFLISGVQVSMLATARAVESAKLVEQTYLVRYGVMAHVARFSAFLDGDVPLERGQFVVIESERGIELGEILTVVGAPGVRARPGGDDAIVVEAGTEYQAGAQRARTELLRLASADDLARARSAAQERAERYRLCHRVLEQFNWPWELIDVETLLDEQILVLHYLGPHQLDAAEIRAWFRTAHNLDVLFEPAGIDESSPMQSDVDGAGNGHGCGASGCGNGGCGSDFGAAQPALDPSAARSAAACGTSAHSGCSSCGIMRAMTERNQRMSLP